MLGNSIYILCKLTHYIQVLYSVNISGNVSATCQATYSGLIINIIMLENTSNY